MEKLLEVMKAEAQKLMGLCVKELTNTLLFVNETDSIIGTATITVGRYEVKDVSVCILGTNNVDIIIKGYKISPRFTVSTLTRREYNEKLKEKQEINKENLRKKACEAYFKGVK